MDFLKEEKLINLINRLLNQSPVLKEVKNGRQLIYYSPFVSHRKRKLEINLPSLKWHCWISDKGGTSIKSLFYNLKASKSLIVELFEILGVSNYNNIQHKYQSTCDTSLKLPDDFLPLYKKVNSIEYNYAFNYCKKRNISESEILKYNIGYCLDGKYKNRLILPSYDSNFRLNYFVSRTWFNDSYNPYINCDFSKNVIGFDSFINWNYPITIVEGFFDAVAVNINCIPLFGKTLSQSLILKILEKGVRQINLCLDNDAFKNSLHICNKFINMGIDIKFVRLNDKDPSKIGYNRITEIINNTGNLTQSDLFQLNVLNKINK